MPKTKKSIKTDKKTDKKPEVKTVDNIIVYF